MANKLIYETTLLVCSSCVIFTGTVSAVLLMLVWPNDRILGLSTRLVIGLCLIIVAIFSVGFVGTIAESTNALIIYACLLILFPVSVLLVEIILRLTSSLAVPVPTLNHNENGTSSTATASSSNTDSDASVSTMTPGTTVWPPTLTSTIYSNSFSYSDSSISLLSSYSINNDLNMTLKESNIPGKMSSEWSSSSGWSAVNALISSSPSYLSVKQNQSNQILLSDGKFVTSSSDSVVGAEISNLQSINQKNYESSSSSAKHLQSNNQMPLTPIIQGGLFQSKSIHFNENSKGNFLSKIFTASLNHRVETCIEYILVGMLAFVLLQIVISYLLAFEIRTIRSKLRFVSHFESSNKNHSLEHDSQEVTNLQQDVQTSLYQLDPESVGCSSFGQSIFADIVQSPFNVCSLNKTYNCCNHFPATHSSHTPLNACQHSFDKRPLVQVHVNPDDKAIDQPSIKQSIKPILTMCDEQSDQRTPTPPQPPTISSSLITNKTNRRNRSGSFRVTFESFPKFFEATTVSNEKSSSVMISVPNESLEQSSGDDLYEHKCSTERHFEEHQPHPHYHS